LLLCVVVAGALFGALNGARVGIDFYVLRCDVPLGGALLGALVLGWLLGGLVAWLDQWPRVRRLQRTIRELHARDRRRTEGGDDA
ncbi:MAG TPA: lipopolysaccharide assembly protein LapA domain-containing protein, partial [Dokdonella sp.]|nr:lipopolysaccharide assembly protein LapA domain-containing protein [Dokdonella sp.]